MPDTGRTFFARTFRVERAGVVLLAFIALGLARRIEGGSFARPHNQRYPAYRPRAIKLTSI